MDDPFNPKIDMTVSPAHENDTSVGVIGQPKRGVVLVPVMSTEDTLKKKSSKGHKLQQIVLPDTISMDDFKEVLAGSYLAFTARASGAAPRVEDVAKYVDLPVGKIQLIMATPAYKAAATVRGITVGKRTGLTVEQDYALQIILDPTQGAGLKERLRKAKVPMNKYRAWMKNPLFRDYVETVGGGILHTLENDIIVSIAGRAAEGDLAAGKFALELSGRYDPDNKQIMDMQVFMASVVEIIKQHVKDPDALKAIGTDMMLLSSRAGISDAKIARQEIEG